MAYDPNEDYDVGGGKGVLPTGWAVVAIVDAEAGTSQSSGNATAKIRFQCIASKGDAKTGKVMTVTMIADTNHKAFWRYAQIAKAISAPGHEPTDDTELKNALLGGVLVIKVATKAASNGYEESVKLGGGASGKPRALTANEAARLKEKFGDSMVPADLWPAGRPNATGGAGDDDGEDYEDDDDDDIPF